MWPMFHEDVVLRKTLLSPFCGGWEGDNKIAPFGKIGEFPFFMENKSK